MKKPETRDRDGGLDKYYTLPDMAKMFMETIPYHKYDDIMWIEPSAGAGVFMDIASKYDGTHVGFDISPDANDIIEANWLETKRNWLGEHTGSIIVYGNPPFGFASHLAVKFFNHAAREYNADVIAFILPRTFMKRSIIKRLDIYYHLTYQQIIDDDDSMFLVNGV